MAIIRPFAALRPRPELVDKVAELPYDVMSSEEARVVAAGNPYSFLHVDKAEIDLPPTTGLYDEIVYRTARENLRRMVDQGVFIREAKPCLYLYKQVMNGRAQIGVVACSAIDDYLHNVIKKHELTRADKEEDRCRHVAACAAQTGPIFLTYRARKGVNAIAASVMQARPLYDFVSSGQVAQTVWRIDNAETIASLTEEFAAAGCTYIADGHHRTASAVRVGVKMREQNPGYNGSEEFNYFLSVLFPDEQLYIMDYNRVVKDLNGLTQEEFLARMSEKFIVRPHGSGACRPEAKHSFGMYLDGGWYLLTAREGSFDAGDPVARLDVSILQHNLLSPILGIGDPRTDKRIDFIGGIRGLAELEQRVNQGAGAAFAMFATTVGDLMDIADAGQIMPPKSTWFEPKLLSGIFIHELE